VITEIMFRFNRGKYSHARELLFQEHPRLSIIVPGKDEGKHLVKLVKSLEEQSYRNFELIIIDDGSTDDTPVICRNLLRKGKIDRYLRNEIRGGKASAANLGLKYAESEYIIHLDADSSFDRDAIERIMIPFFLDPKIGIVAGNIKVRNASEGIMPSLQAIEYLKSIPIGRRITSLLGILRIASGAFGAFRKDILNRFGGWDVGPGLDGDITVKVRKLKFKVAFEPRAICFTSVPVTVRGLARQRTRWGRSLVRFRMKKHRDIFFPNQNFSFLNLISSVENVFYGLILNILWIVYIGDILLNLPHTAKFIIPINYLLYCMSNLSQFIVIMAVSERRKEELKLAPYIPLMPFYMGLYMRIVRTWAYVSELFLQSSYKDPWNPKKVSDKAREIGI
jgi:cellulose synthase/poly-beta-1,6-N-acetylglucosamine synthase-like glycosyltransferase